MSFFRELKETLWLAGPVALAQISAVVMNLVDTAMVSPLGAEALGSVALGISLFFTPSVFFMGVLGVMSPITAQRHGAGDRQGVAQVLEDGWWLTLGLGALGSGFLVWLAYHSDLVGVRPELMDSTADYLLARTPSLLPLLFCIAYRGNLEGQGFVMPAFWSTVAANLVNIAGNWLLIYGKLGFPALGIAGAGLATSLASVVQAAWLANHIRRGRSEPVLHPGWVGVRRILRLGVPMGLHQALEVGIFSAGALLMNRFGTAPTAAHQIAIQLATCTFMVAMGLSVAASTRVGQALGRGDPAGAERAGWITIGLGLVFMSLSAILFRRYPVGLIHLFTDDPEVERVGVALLRIAGAFQLVDGLQAVTTGALRGAGDTRFSLYASLVGYWGVGLPLCLLLGFGLGWGPEGIWWGLAIGLGATALGLVFRFWDGAWKRLGAL